MCFGCNDIRFYTHVHGLVHSILSLQHEIHILQVTIECCGNLATKLCVGPVCSPIQPSLLGWPRQSTDKPTMQVDSMMQVDLAFIWFVKGNLPCSKHICFLQMVSFPTVPKFTLCLQSVFWKITAIMVHLLLLCLQWVGSFPWKQSKCVVNL